MGENTTTQLDAWLGRLREGDHTAFGELVRYFERRLEILASRMLKGFPVVASKEETGDVLQGALLRLTKALSALAVGEDGPAGRRTFHGDDFFRFAALQIRRELLDLASYHRRRPVAPLHDDALDRLASDTFDPLRLAAWTKFHETAAALPQNAREVFDLIYYGGLKQEDAATLLGVTSRTVRQRWQDARLELSALLGGKMPG